MQDFVYISFPRYHTEPTTLIYLIIPSKIVKNLRNLVKMRLQEARIHRLAYSGDLEEVRNEVRRGADLEARDYNYMTPLHVACLKGHEGIACLLIEHGAEVDSNDVSRMTPFHSVCVGYQINPGACYRIAKLLLENGADVNSQDTEKFRPLHGSVLCGDEDLIYLLLQYGANIDAKNEDGSTALHLAAGRGDRQIVDLLLRNGANHYLRDCDGKTAQDVAKPGFVVKLN